MSLLLGAGFFKTVGTVIECLGIILTGFVQFFIFGVLWLLWAGVAIIAHFCEVAFKKLVGIDEIFLNGQSYAGASGDGHDLVYGFITNTAVQNVFWSILALSLVLLFIFTIVALIKSEFTLDLKGSAKGPIFARAFKSLANFIIVPTTAIISIFGVNFLTKSIYDMFGGEDASIVSKCFVLGGYNANRARLSSDFANQLKEGEYSDSDQIFSNGSNPFSGRSSEQIAQMVDDYFVSHKETSLEYHTASFIDRLSNYNDGSANYINVTALFFGAPNNGNFYYTQVDTVNFYYDIAKFDYILSLGSLIVMSWTLLSVALVLLKRVFEMTILFLLAPPMTAIAPLDGGQAEKKWRQEFMKRLLATIGPIFAINMYFLLVPLFENIRLFGSSAGIISSAVSSGSFMLGEVSGFIFQFINIFDLFFQIVCILTGLSIVKSASGLLSNLLGVDDLIKSGGENMKKAIDSGQKAFGLATAVGGVAIKGLAAGARGAAGIVKAAKNRRTEGGKSAKDAKKELKDTQKESDAANKDYDDALEKAKQSDAYTANEEEIKKLEAKEKLGGSLSEEDQKKLTKLKGNRGDILSKDADLAAASAAKEKADKDLEARKAGISKSMQQKLEKNRASDKKILEDIAENGDKDGKKKSEIDKHRSYEKKVREQAAIGGFGKQILKAYDAEYGEDSGSTNLLGGVANKVNKWAEKTKIPFVSARLKKTTKALSEYLNVSGDTATRRLNDKLGDIFGEGGGQALWKINFNGNARAALFEGVPESKKRTSKIDQGILSEARDNWQKGEIEKAEKKNMYKEIARMIATEKGDKKMAALLEQRKKAEQNGNSLEVKNIDAKIEKLNINKGYLAEARQLAGDKGFMNSDKYRAFKEGLKEEAYLAEKAKEKAEKQYAAKFSDSLDSDKPQKTETTDENINKQAAEIARKLAETLKKTKLDINAEALTQIFTSASKSMMTDFTKALEEALKNLGNGGDKK